MRLRGVVQPQPPVFIYVNRRFCKKVALFEFDLGHRGAKPPTTQDFYFFTVYDLCFHVSKHYDLLIDYIGIVWKNLNLNSTAHTP